MARVRDMLLGSMLLGSGSGNSGMTIELLLNTSTYVLTANLKDKKGTVVSTSSIDLPLESTVVSGSYDNTNKKLVLTLVSGETIDIPVGDLIDGLQSTIQYSTIPTASADYVGKIVQFIGTTDNNYTNGYFYICKSTESGGTTTYSWTNLNVQPGEESPIKELTLPTNNYTKYTWEQLQDNGVVVGQWYCVKTKFSYGTSITRYFNIGTLICFASGGTALYIKPFLSGPAVSNLQFVPEIYQINYTGDVGNGNFMIDGDIYRPLLRYGVSGTGINFKKALATDNTTAFTPTADSYQPATAKYSEKMVETVAPVYSASSTYDLGDFVSYQGKMYKCTTAISTAESWDSTHWTETTVVDNLGGESDFPIWDNPTTFGLNFTDIDSSIKNQQWRRLKNQMYLKLASWHQGSYIVASPNALINFSTYGGIIINPAQGSNSLSDRIIAFNAISTNAQIWQPQFSNCRTYFNHSVFESNYPYAGVKFVLDTANTEAYTPTGDYNPATKKYVDDAISSAITTTLGGSY